MDVEYCVTESTIYFDNCQFNSYGISAVIKTSAKTSSEFPDISFDKNFVEKITNLLNYYEVDECQFKEIIIDELNR
ncbi:MAG: DUF6514 family protein [Acutalibacteraceae bacterium]